MKKVFFIAFALCVFLPVEIYSVVTCFSRAIPDIPTEQDSVIIESTVYLVAGKVVDSAISVSDNTIAINLYATDSAITNGYAKCFRNYSVGRFNAGEYRIITTGNYIRSRRVPVDTVIEDRDTASFKVFPAGSTPPRVVGYINKNTYYYVDETYPKRSYYYWNGDTLSIGISWYDPQYGRKFIPHIGLNSDTIVFDIIDTSFNVMPMFQSYFVVSSVHPVVPGHHPIRIRYVEWGSESKMPSRTNPIFHSFTADHRNSGIGLSFKKAGQPEFIIFPNDTFWMNFLLYSPFLDTFKILSIQPNPYNKITNTGHIEIHNITSPSGTIENWEGFSKNVWRDSLVQQSDRLSYDTVSNSVNDDHWMQIKYSNDSGLPVRSYIYRTLNPELQNQASEMSLVITGRIKNPDSISSLMFMVKKDKSPDRPAIQVSNFGSNIVFIFNPVNSLRSNKKLQPAIKIIDLQGRLIQTLGAPYLRNSEGSITAVWDKRNTQGNPVPKGIYLAQIWGTYHSIIINVSQ